MGVLRLDMDSKPLAGGRAFGEVGPYEELTGQAVFAVDPLHPLNRGVTDLELAPRAADGRVEFSADLRILRPVDASRGNRGIFLDVVNRGTSIFVRMTEPGPMGPTTPLSAGWLLQRGYTVVSCGWQHDVPRGGGRFGLTAPHALVDGQTDYRHGDDRQADRHLRIATGPVRRHRARLRLSSARYERPHCHPDHQRRSERTR